MTVFNKQNLRGQTRKDGAVSALEQPFSQWPIILPEYVLMCTDADNTVRWQPGERLHHLFEQRCEQLIATGDAEHIAVVGADQSWTYVQLNECANQCARYLLQLGFKAGDCIGLLFDKSVHSYIAMLAVLKIQAAYVPLDPAFPPERIAYMAADAKMRGIVTLERYAALTHAVPVKVVYVDTAATAISAQAKSCLTVEETGKPVNELCYIIYTSGSTGRPKGVPIEQASICNFVRVAAELYGYQATDRVYQGLTLAFDFAVEEIWVPLIVGATLVPNQTGSSLLGSDLADFLRTQRITALCCVPTLLATVEDDIPDLRLLIVSGEACPQDLLSRWYAPHRSILNAYGPTETTVTATLARPQPHTPMTIGKPLPTYTVMILQPDAETILPWGEEGEIVIAGVGVAQGYLHRPQATAKAFIHDFVPLPNNPSGLLYRTGDLGVINAQGEIEYRGRMDFQVKIRGYRIELTEIESVLLQHPAISQAVVETCELAPGVKELVAYYTLKAGAPALAMAELVSHLRSKLPCYMVPAYYECLAEMPLLASDKADRTALPKPSGQRLYTSARTLVEPRTASEHQIAAILGSLLQLEAVSIEDHFFEDLGASSLLMAQFSTKLRKNAGLSQVSMRDIYTYPTVAQLATYLDSLAQPQATQTAESETSFYIPSKFSYYSCGVLQLGFYLLYTLAFMGVMQRLVDWILATPDSLAMYERTVIACTSGFFAWIGLAIAAKWLLIGKWRAQSFPIWSLRYVRFWVVKQLLVINPMSLFRGYPLYNLYLRLLGAKIGRNVVVEAEHIPIGTDLLSIGDNTILQQYSILLSYKAHANDIHIGPVSLGKRVLIGEGSVIDIHTSMADDAQLAHASSLHAGQTIPQGKRYHGTPAQATTSDFRFAVEKPLSRTRVVVYSIAQILLLCGVLLPLLVAINHELIYSFGLPVHPVFSLGWTLDIFVDAGMAFMGLLLLNLLLAITLPHLLNHFLYTERDYVRYGWHFFIYRLQHFASNSIPLNLLFGDSSLATTYLQRLGYHLQPLVQTGSNFGLEQRHDNALLCEFGTRTMISDGLTMLNVQQSSTAFRLVRNRIEDDSFVGNNVFYPVGAKAGTHCLLATKVMVPIDGKVREGVGLLGSPSFEIPRMLDEDKTFDPFAPMALRLHGLRRKDFSNLFTIGAFLFAGFLHLFVTLVLIYAAAQSHVHMGLFAWVLAGGVFTLLSTLYFIVLERAAYGFKRMQPMTVSLYDPDYWRVERLWKFSESVLRWLWLGTPFRCLINRALGIRQGKMVFDDGLYVSEKTLVTLGDYCNCNLHSVLQGHSLEQGRYKSGYIKVGNQCTIEANAFVHYGVTVGDNVRIGPDSFVMKGETLERGEIWRGNPARAV